MSVTMKKGTACLTFGVTVAAGDRVLAVENGAGHSAESV